LDRSNEFNGLARSRVAKECAEVEERHVHPFLAGQLSQALVERHELGDAFSI
jgi:hypothetical protein